MHHPIQSITRLVEQFCTTRMSARSRRKLLEDCVESNALLCPRTFLRERGLHQTEGNAFKIEWTSGNETRIPSSTG